MIVGVFYKVNPGKDNTAIPVFARDTLEFVGFPQMDQNEIKWAITWGGKDVPDTVEEKASVNARYFLNMFGNMWYPKKDEVIPLELVFCVFDFWSKQYTSHDVWNAILVAEEKQKEYWRDLKAEISGLTEDQIGGILAGYRFYGKAKDVATTLNLDRQLVKQVVLQQLKEYAWE